MPRTLRPLKAASPAMFAVQIDFPAALQSAVPKMARDLDTSASDLQWVISGHLLAEAAVIQKASIRRTVWLASTYRRAAISMNLKIE